MAIIQNPVIPGFNPDPSIVRVGKDYFCTTSTFEYFPGAAIYHSLDLIKWELIGHALTRKSQLDVKTVEPGGGVWAATLRFSTATGPKPMIASGREDFMSGRTISGTRAHGQIRPTLTSQDLTRIFSGTMTGLFTCRRRTEKWTDGRQAS